MDNKIPGKDISDSDLLDKFPLASKKNKDHFSKFSINNSNFGSEEIVIMAGPNTIENKDMAFRTAEFLKKRGVQFFRGGAFKPLTFPYRSDKYFELREEGLRILQEVRKEFDISIITEIMEESKVNAVAEVADILQIGTRNMQNFPLITNCAKTQKPIMLKRHFGCSIRDLLGSAEYALIEKNKKILLCERGIVAPHTHKSSSRFMLDIQFVPAIKEISHLPIVLDPSHACFWSPWVESLSLASIAAGTDAIMLEVHPDPRNAAVDPLQPLSFEEYNDLHLKMSKVAEAVGKKING